eukprot:sb/3474300/
MVPSGMKCTFKVTPYRLQRQLVKKWLSYGRNSFKFSGDGSTFASYLQELSHRVAVISHLVPRREGEWVGGKEEVGGQVIPISNLGKSWGGVIDCLAPPTRSESNGVWRRHTGYRIVNFTNLSPYFSRAAAERTFRSMPL